MPASNFADLIISKIKSAIGDNSDNYNSNTPNLANKAISEGITEYLKNNTTVPITYSGIIPSVPPVPDPVVTDILNIEGSCAPISSTGEFNSWILDLSEKIQSGFFLGSGNLGITSTTPNSVLCFMSGPPLALTQDELKNLHISNMNSEEPNRIIWEYICQKIIIWLNSIPGISFPGINTNSGSQGVGTVVKIIVI